MTQMTQNALKKKMGSEGGEGDRPILIRFRVILSFCAFVSKRNRQTCHQSTKARKPTQSKTDSHFITTFCCEAAAE